jgi:predicted HicB family RNase H-like nuclease
LTKRNTALVRINADLHKRVKVDAARRGIRMLDWMRDAITMKLQRPARSQRGAAA